MLGGAILELASPMPQSLATAWAASARNAPRKNRLRLIPGRLSGARSLQSNIVQESGESRLVSPVPGGSPRLRCAVPFSASSAASAHDQKVLLSIEMPTQLDGTVRMASTHKE